MSKRRKFLDQASDTGRQVPYNFQHQLKPNELECFPDEHRELDPEWIKLIQTARDMGMKIDEVRQYLRGISVAEVSVFLR